MMEEIRWWTRLLLVSAIVAVVLLIVAPLGYKFELAALGPSFISLILAIGGAMIVLLFAIAMAIVAARQALPANRNLLLITMAIALVPIIVMTPQILKGRSVPSIHDITTDTANPPQFYEVVDLRGEDSNSLEYGDGFGSPAELAGLQQAAYPAVKSLAVELAPADALAKAESVLERLGLEIVNVDASRGVVEAVATTFWFGFKDDVVVRISPQGAGSRVDVRSVSRVGQSDLGANAARIEKILLAFGR